MLCSFSLSKYFNQIYVHAICFWEKDKLLFILGLVIFPCFISRIYWSISSSPECKWEKIINTGDYILFWNHTIQINCYWGEIRLLDSKVLHIYSQCNHIYAFWGGDCIWGEGGAVFYRWAIQTNIYLFFSVKASYTKFACLFIIGRSI